MDYLFHIKKQIEGMDNELIIIFLPTLENISDNTLRFEDGTTLRFPTMIRSDDLSSELEWVILEPKLGITDTFLLIREDCIGDENFKVNSGRAVLDTLIKDNLYAVMITYYVLRQQESESKSEFTLEEFLGDLLEPSTKSNTSNSEKKSFWDIFKK